MKDHQPGHPPVRRRHFDIHAWADDWRSLRIFLSLHAWSLIIGAGTALRVFGFLRARQFWLDESMLYGNVMGQPFWHVVGPLKQEQVVPPGYLMTLRAIDACFGSARLPLRFTSFLAGTMAFLVFAFWARKSLPRKVGLIAAALLAFNTDALYYTQEMKPYAFDLLTTVLLIWFLDQLRESNDEIRLRRLWLGVSITLGVAPWFSIASVFPAAAFLALSLYRSQKERSAMRPVIIAGAVWCVSFLSAWSIEKSQVVSGSVLWNFWDFAFLKPLRPLDTFCVLADNFLNPLHWITSFESELLMFAWLAVVCGVLLAGVRALSKVNPALARFALATVFLAVVASLTRFYPFHGRTVLFLIPFFEIAFAWGVVRFTSRTKRLQGPLIFCLLAVPLCSSLWIRPFSNNRLISFDGDLEYDHFTPRYGVLKRTNAMPVAKPKVPAAVTPESESDAAQPPERIE